MRRRTIEMEMRSDHRQTQNTEQATTCMSNNAYTNNATGSEMYIKSRGRAVGSRQLEPTVTVQVEAARHLSSEDVVREAHVAL
jgi:hypothetical protein